MWAFGDGDYGKLGLGNSTAKSVPTKVEAMCNVGIKKVACGTQFTVALTKDGRIFTWGQGILPLCITISARESQMIECCEPV